jgi:pyruvate/2-oxoglutarate dehydrogenase complex dihydrolipoamide dehydrogenase (E3) component
MPAGDPHLALPLIPDDTHDQIVRENSHPSDWVNPTAEGIYNLVVLGGGTAGLVSAAGAALLGAKVALVERALTGGDCLVTGCVPSKAVIRAARAAYDARDAKRFGVGVPDPVEVDFAAAMDRMRSVRAAISRHDAAKHFRDEWGVEVYFGDARFGGPDSVEVAGQRLNFRRCIIATGGRPIMPDVPGLAEASCYTNETIFNLTERPPRLAVVGAGPIGCEMAQAFARLGSQVTLIHSGGQLLPRDDPDAAKLILGVFRREGVDVRLNTSLRRVEPRGGGGILSVSAAGGEMSTLEAEAILVAAGRAPNVEGLNLEGAGVRYTKEGVAVDDFLRTSNPRVYAAGDVCLAHKFTHAADASARLAIQNALLHLRKRVSKLVIPWCTYTDPEVARVGIDEREARGRGSGIRTFTIQMDDVDRALTDGETDGFLKVHLPRRGDRILGATFVSRHAGETISQVTTAMMAGVGLRGLADVIHPYPTQAEAIRKAADECFRQDLSPLLRRVVRRWLAWRR